MNRQAGFNMTELMIVVAIVAILLSVGIPSYRYITNSYRMSAEVNGLMGDLMYARAEAIKEGYNVTACTSANGVSCDPGAVTWQEGWIIFQDVNADQTVDAGDNVLRVQQTFQGGDTFLANNGVNAISFNREGFATVPTGAAGFLNTTIALKDKTANAAWTRCLFITNIGQMSTETPTQLALNSTGCP
jgi:type IV fimbrial biogenesis protein FimT